MVRHTYTYARNVRGTSYYIALATESVRTVGVQISIHIATYISVPIIGTFQVYTSTYDHNTTPGRIIRYLLHTIIGITPHLSTDRPGGLAVTLECYYTSVEP